jgi:flavin reductase (DIM6/NTAB) family NADH-FMN oxidoreductase RutF
MRSFDPKTLDKRTAYYFMISAIVPRPIAFVTSVNADGVVNAAPFSYFTGISSQPPIIAVAVGERRGEPKDTMRNIESGEEFVVNVVNEGIAEQMVQASNDYPADVSEIDATGLKTVPSEVVVPPRIAESPVHLECRLREIVRLDGVPGGLILGEVVRYHAAEEVLDENGIVDISKLKPLGRLGGAQYCGVDRVWEIERPSP